MRLGFMTNILVKKGMVHLDEIAEWAAARALKTWKWTYRSDGERAV